MKPISKPISGYQMCWEVKNQDTCSEEFKLELEKYLDKLYSLESFIKMKAPLDSNIMLTSNRDSKLTLLAKKINK